MTSNLGGAEASDNSTGGNVLSGTLTLSDLPGAATCGNCTGGRSNL